MNSLNTFSRNLTLPFCKETKRITNGIMIKRVRSPIAKLVFDTVGHTRSPSFLLPFSCMHE